MKGYSAKRYVSIHRPLSIFAVRPWKYAIKTLTAVRHINMMV